ncbi:MAG: ROK family glucokinase [Acutalibacteraceae bacterium]|nr:ROK family glucokinase [Acutalibacteraceae bacterium]
MYWLGIDLGGTNIATGVVDENYNIIGRGKVKTNRAGRTPDDIADDMAKAVFMAIEDAGIDKSEIVAMGIGSPGSIVPETGTVAVANNLGFKNLPLCQMLKDRTGFDFYIENDANAAAYGELLAGAGRGKKNFVAITLGTGVGGGIIIDGKIFSGFNHAGGEVGHTVIVQNGEQCACGRQGCWEAYASATALIRQTKFAMIKDPTSVMWEIAGTIENVNGLTAFDAMRRGDETAKKVVDQYIEYIAVGLVNMINIFQPEVICIGGGVSKEGDTLIKPIKSFARLDRYSKNVAMQTEIKTAELGNDAGIIGAAFLCNLYK